MKKLSILKKYAAKFCDKVRSEMPALNLTEKKPHILLYKKEVITECDSMKKYIEYANDINSEYATVSGFYSMKDGCIELYGTDRYELKEIKQTLRHECIHFLLHQSGYPYNDEDFIFLLLACQYDARPYSLLNVDTRTKFEMMLGNETA